jgi:hypothetical protein
MVVVITLGLILTIVLLIMSITADNALAWKAVVKKPKPEVGTWHYQTGTDIHKAELFRR